MQSNIVIVRVLAVFNRHRVQTTPRDMDPAPAVPTEATNETPAPSDQQPGGGETVGKREETQPSSGKSDDAAPMSTTSSDEPNTHGGGLQRVIPMVLESHQSDFQFHMCDCVSLITTDKFTLQAKKPNFADVRDCSVDVGAEAQTLFYLRKGYHNYLENSLSEEIHILTAYTCKVPASGLYSIFKSILCKDYRPQTSARDTHGTTEREQRVRMLMEAANQYVTVFSILTDFNFTWLTPSLKCGLCNVLVVDKVWDYHEARGVYAPWYRLLCGDMYTDTAVAAMLRLKNGDTCIREVKFLSTPTTRLYTNAAALLRDEDGERGQKRVRVEDVTRGESTPKLPRRDISTQPPLVATHSLQETSAAAASTSNPPASLQEAASTLTAAHTAATKTFALRTDGCPANIHQKKVGHGALQKEPATVKNPTLIVFKHITDNARPDVLLCNIILEIDLARGATC